jgi:hypothetical protein
MMKNYWNEKIVFFKSRNIVFSKMVKIHTSEYFQCALESIQIKMMSDTINTNNIVITIVRLIKIVERYKNVNGLEKKNLVISVILRLIQMSDLDNTSKNYLTNITLNTGYQIIDAIIFATKGKVFRNFFFNLKFSRLFG